MGDYFGEIDVPPDPIPKYQGAPKQGMAPRTFEVIQREKQKAAGDRLLGAYDKDKGLLLKERGIAARDAMQGSPLGGARAASTRRTAAEAAMATPHVDRAQAELALLGEERGLGDLESDRMMKIEKLEGWIASLKEAGYGGYRLDQIIRAAAAQQTDPDIKLYLEQRIS